MPETGLRHDPFRNYNFLVEIDDIARGAFQEANGLQVTTEVVEYREGGDQTTRKLPGRTSYGNIVLRRGVTADDSLWLWHREVINGKDVRRNGSIVVLDLDINLELARWNFIRAWPTQYEGPSFDATANELAIEAFTLAHEGLVRA